ncbi:kinase-like protein, partial [Rhizophagus irregularis]
WIPYDQFDNIKEIGKGGFSTVYSAIWKNGLLYYDDDLFDDEKWIRNSNTKVALKCLHNSQNALDEFINEVKAYPRQKINNILKIYGISQNPSTKEYIMVLEYAEGGNFNNYFNKNYENFNWFNGLKILTNIIEGLSKIHQKQMVHRDFHIGNILFIDNNYNACISDLGLSKKIDDINETSIYGVMPYVAPEVLKGKPYTYTADIYSFGMIMYVMATGRQPFINYAHDEVLVLNICNGIRPEINEKITPKCYIDLMKKCWDSNPDNRPNSLEIKEMIELFCNSLDQEFEKKEQQHYKIEEQFKETQDNRKENLSSIKINQLPSHKQAIYTSRLLNPFTKSLPKHDDNINNNTVEIIDFTNMLKPNNKIPESFELSFIPIYIEKKTKTLSLDQSAEEKNDILKRIKQKDEEIAELSKKLDENKTGDKNSNSPPKNEMLKQRKSKNAELYQKSKRSDGTNEALSRIRIIESLSVKVAYKYKSVKAKIRLIRAADENFVNGGVKRKFQDFRDGKVPVDQDIDRIVKYIKLYKAHAVHFEPTTNTSSTQQWDNVPVDKELYFDATDQSEIEPTSTHIGNSKEVVEEFTNLNGDFSKRLPMKPLLSTKPKEDNVSSDDSDETKESNKKKRKIRN